MEQRHKDILIEQRANLVDNLNMRDGLYTQLISRKVINSRMMRTIKFGHTEDQQAEDLLDTLPKCGPKAFEGFCEALVADFQESVVSTYLKPECTEETASVASDATSGTQESSNSSMSGTSQSQVPQSPSGALDNNGTGGGVSGQAVNDSHTGVSIREEFQHQMYRRSIEPSNKGDREVLVASKSQTSGVVDLSQEARFFYQNSMLDPHYQTSSIFSVNDSNLNALERERILYAMMSKTGANVSHASEYPIGKTRESMLVTDHAGLGRSYKSEPLLETMQSQNKPPNVFTSSSSSPQKAFGESPFSFHTLDKKHLSNSQNRQVLSHQAPREGDIIREGRNLYSEIHSSPSSHPSIPKSMPHSIPTERHFYERIENDSGEFRRYIEVVNPGGNGHEGNLISLPRHIERSVYSPSTSEEPGLHQLSRFQSEELATRGGNQEIARLSRGDSVDTMHKRPLAEHNECCAAKRAREDVDNIPVLVKPDAVQPLVKVFDQTENKVISIPVMEPPVRQPSQPTMLIQPDTHREKQSMGMLLGAMDDPEIDLTDGPINVKVDLCTRPFYISHYKQAYAMRNIPRGKALILNVNEVVGKSPRRGTDIDRENLHNLLCQLHFDVTVYNDEDGLTAKEMVLKLQDFSQHVDHKAGDCAVVCILSHGEEGYIFGADGRKFELDAVFELFNNTCCPNLRGKPKIFIIQACRGGALDRGVQYYADEHDGSDARVRQVPSMSDMVICYPTQNGYYAWRNRDRGSWYVEALVQVVMKYAKCEDLCTMLNRVNLLVSKKVSHCPNLDMDQMSQMSEYKSTLRMPHLYFFPGIGGC